jgi:hypothetical protein
MHLMTGSLRCHEQPVIAEFRPGEIATVFTDEEPYGQRWPHGGECCRETSRDLEFGSDGRDPIAARDSGAVSLDRHNGALAVDAS